MRVTEKEKERARGKQGEGERNILAEVENEKKPDLHFFCSLKSKAPLKLSFLLVFFSRPSVSHALRSSLLPFRCVNANSRVSDPLQLAAKSTEVQGRKALLSMMFQFRPGHALARAPPRVPRPAAAAVVVRRPLPPPLQQQQRQQQRQQQLKRLPLPLPRASFTHSSGGSVLYYNAGGGGSGGFGGGSEGNAASSSLSAAAPSSPAAAAAALLSTPPPALPAATALDPAATHAAAADAGAAFACDPARWRVFLRGMIAGGVTTFATAAALSAAVARCGGGGSSVSLSNFSPSASFAAAASSSANNASITAATLAIALVAQPLGLAAASAAGGESSASAWHLVGCALFERRRAGAGLRFFFSAIRAAMLVGLGQALGAALAALAVVSGAKLPFVGVFASAALAGPWASPWASSAGVGTFPLLFCLAMRAAVGDRLVASGALQARSARCVPGRTLAGWPWAAAAGALGLGHSAATLSLAALVAASALSACSLSSLSSSLSNGVVAALSASLLAPAIATVALSALAGGAAGALSVSFVGSLVHGQTGIRIILAGDRARARVREAASKVRGGVASGVSNVLPLAAGEEGGGRRRAGATGAP